MKPKKENQRLKRQIQKIENSMPKVAVGFSVDSSTTARFQIGSPESVDEDSVVRSILEIRNSTPEIVKPDPKPIPPELVDAEKTMSALARKFSGSNRNTIADDEYVRYENDRVRYIERYETFLRTQLDADNLLKRMIRFTIVIENNGSAPAEDVDVKLHFPDGFTLCEEDDLPEFPGEPNPPVEPRTPIEIMQSRIGRLDIGSIGRMHVPNFQLPSSFNLKRTNSYDIEDHFTRIKHGFQAELPELFLIFDSFQTSGSFNCDYEVRVGNLPDPIIGKLNFVIDKSNLGDVDA